MSLDYKHIIRQAYLNFNNRNIDGVLALMHPEVHWPKAFDGGYVSGHQAIRDYWSKQWSEINPHVEPTGFNERGQDVVAVDVHQVVKGLDGSTLFDGNIRHIYRFQDGLIREMNIELDDQPATH